MQFIKYLFARLYEGGIDTQQNENALHYFITHTKSRDKRRVLEIVAKKVNEDQRKTIQKARRLTTV